MKIISIILFTIVYLFAITISLIVLSVSGGSTFSILLIYSICTTLMVLLYFEVFKDYLYK